MLNKYMWQLYLKAGGDKTVKRFEDNFTNGMKKDYVNMIYELHKCYHVGQYQLDDETKRLNNLCEYLSKNNESPFEINPLKSIFAFACFFSFKFTTFVIFSLQNSI